MRRFTLFVLISLLLPAIGLAADSGNENRPNIVLINLDDADLDLMSPQTIASRFPNMNHLVTDGLYFSNLHVTTPKCGPSRACLLRGQYAHRTGIRVNNPNNAYGNGMQGGMPEYILRGYMEEEMSVWVKRAGYRTMLVGKYLNGDFVAGVPPGWDDYYNSLGGSYFDTKRYTNRNNSAGNFEQLAPGVYRTRAEAEDAVSLIQQHVDSGRNQPFFLYVAPFAPHHPAAKSTGGAAELPYSKWWSKAVVPFSKDRVEFDFSDKTSVLNHLQPLNENGKELADSLYRDRLRTTRSVDDLYGNLMASLEANDLLDNTYVMVTSDNGFQLGHQRMIGKGNNYDRSTRVPLYVTGPNVARGKQAKHLLAHVDITATILDLAGATAPVPQDGQSFVPLLEQPGAVEARQWRDPVLVQNWESKASQSATGEKIFVVASGLRLFDAIYTEWADGTSEYFDLASDPHQLDNLYPTLPNLEQQALQVLLRQSKSEMLPVTSVSTPLRQNEVVTAQTVLAGLAEDDQGIRSVKLTIRDLRSRDYWDGQGWTDQYTRVTAELAQPGHQISVWRYHHLPPEAKQARKIVVWARSYSETGQFDPFPVKRQMTITSNGPIGHILYPTPGEQLPGPFTVRGDYGSGHEIENVRVVLLRLADRKYWDGNEWTSDWSYINPSLGSDEWELEVDVEPGDYFLSSRLQSSDSIQGVPAKLSFRVTED